MNYFQLVLMVFVFSLFTNNLYGQGAYVNINAGYGLKMSSQNIDYFNFKNITIEDNSFTTDQVNESLGKGLNIGGAFGYMFNENIGAELGISYLFGGKSLVKTKFTDETRDYTLSSRMLRIIPSIVVASGFEKINPYAKFGLIIGSGSIIHDYYSDDNHGNIEVQKKELNKGIAFGLTSGIGAIFNASDKISFYSELNMVNLSYAPNKGEVTKYTYNGIDELPNMLTREKEFEYVDSYTFNYNNPPDSEPSKVLKSKYPFGSFGVNIGLRINY